MTIVSRNQRFAKDRQEVKEKVLSSIVSLIAVRLAEVDGAINFKEVNEFENCFNLPLPKSEYKIIFAEATSDDMDFRICTQRLLTYFSNDRNFIYDFFDGMFKFASVDGLLNVKEIEFLKDISDILGFKNDFFAEKLRKYMIPKGTANEILSVSHKAKEAEVKKAYRKIVQEFHPIILCQRLILKKSYWLQMKGFQ